MRTALLATSIATLLCACTAPSPDTPAVPATEQPRAADTTPPAGVAAAPTEATPDAAASTTPVDATSDAVGKEAVNQSIDSLLGDHTKYQAVVEELQSAVAADDAARVAALADYPFTVQIAGKPTKLKNATEFQKRYAEFMTPGIRKAVVETRYADLFVNQKGVMFGSGQAWINGICKDSACNQFDVRLVALQEGAQ